MLHNNFLRQLSALTLATLVVGGAASAQSTLTLATPETHVTDATIGSGTAQSTVGNTDDITTRLSTDVNEGRRGLLKFDTETTIPAGTVITSASLTVYVRGGAGDALRRLGVYAVTKSFQETQATWATRKTGYAWTTAGGDLGARVGEIAAPVTPGTGLTVDVTAAVRLAMSDPASRYTRLALVDLDPADATSYRAFHSSETVTAAYRPTLVVTYGTAAPPTGTTLTVLDWNTHYGVGTDGVYDLDRIATRIALINPDVISLNEVTRRAYYSASDDQVARYADLLRAKTGHTWHYTYRTDNGAATGVGNAVLSRFPIDSTSHCQLSARRVAVRAGIVVNGRTVNVWSLHLDSSTGNSMRMTEIRALLPCVAAFAEQKIVAGDFNAKATTAETALMKTEFVDGWLQADQSPAVEAISYPGNTSFGATRNARIDYVFYSKHASALVLQRAEVFDTRAPNGAMPSDHKPLLLTFEVR